MLFLTCPTFGITLMSFLTKTFYCLEMLESKGFDKETNVGFAALLSPLKVRKKWQKL